MTASKSASEKDNSSHIMILNELTSGTRTKFKKSIFQAHACVVESIDEVQSILAAMKGTHPYNRATHLPFAYRIIGGASDNESILEKSDDGGDIGVGDKLLFLLQKWDVQNLILLITRQDNSLSGTLLTGVAQRFSIILDASKAVLEKCFINQLSSQQAAALAKLEAIGNKQQSTITTTAAASQVLLAPETVNFPPNHVGTSDGGGIGGRKAGRVNNFKSTTKHTVPSTNEDDEKLPSINTTPTLDHINVSKSDLDSLKALRKPTKELHLVLVCIAIFLNNKEGLTWEGCRRMLASKSFISRVLTEITPTTVCPKAVTEVRAVLQTPNFTPEVLRRTSVAASELLVFIISVVEEFDKKTLGISKNIIKKKKQPVTLKLKDTATLSNNNKPEVIIKEVKKPERIIDTGRMLLN